MKMKYLFMAMCAASVVIAGVLAFQKNGEYGWFLFVGFLFGVAASEHGGAEK